MAMTDAFKTISPEAISDNTFKLIGKDWMLITAGTPEGFNTMTASWGGFGVIWGKKACFCVIRPHRHTFTFVEKADRFTLSFFDENYRDVLGFCGKYSGKDTDKVAATGITPLKTDSGAVYFDEARLVIECRKLYFQDINPENFLDAEIEKHYPDKDYHRMYIGEIVNCYLKE